MLIAILILTIFNTGLIILIGIGAYINLKEQISYEHRKTVDTIEKDIETSVTALYNMDSIKQKATMSGRCEI